MNISASTQKSYYFKVKFLLGPYIKRIPLVLLLFIGGSFVEVLGIGIIGPYVSLVINGSESLKNINLKSVDFESPNLIVALSISLVFIFFIKSIIAILIQRSILKFSFNCQTLLRDSLLKKYQNMPFIEFSNRNSSDYIQNMQILVSDFSNSVLHNGLRIISESIVLFSILALLALTNTKLFIFFASFFFILVFLYDKIFSKKLSSLGERSSESSREIIQSIQESVNGFKDILILNLREFFKQKVHRSAENFANSHIAYTIIKTAPQYLVDFFIVVILVLVVLLSDIFNLTKDNLSSTLSIFAFAAIRLKPSITILSQGISKLRYGRYSTDKIFSDLFEFEELNIFNESLNQQKNVPIVNFKSLELKDIHFSYDEKSSNCDLIIKKGCLKIKKGQMVGIIGESGSGKTTLVDLILGLLQPQRGKIYYNGIDINDNLDEWRSKIAYLPQDTFIIDGSIKSNIAIGINKKNIDENSIYNAIQLAKLANFIQSIPKKEDTQIGEGAIKISGGQKQRIALARAFYHNKEILILDESTSSLDSKTEDEILKHLIDLKKDKTLIMISHKPSSLIECDTVFRIKDKSIEIVKNL